MDKHSAIKTVWRKMMWVKLAYEIDHEEFISKELGERISKLYFIIYNIYLKGYFGKESI